MAPKPSAQTYEQFEAALFKAIETLPRKQSAELIRALGVDVPADMSARDLGREWAQLKVRARQLWDLQRVVIEATGKTDLQAALEEVQLWHAAHKQHADVTTELAMLSKKRQQNELERLIEEAKAQCKLTPAEVAALRSQFESGDITLRGAATLLGLKQPHKALLAGRDGAEAAVAGAHARSFRWNGKTFAQMTGMDRYRLKNENPELYEAMRAAWMEAGEPGPDPEPPPRAA